MRLDGSMKVGLAATEDVPEGGARCVDLQGRRYALFKVRGTVYCLDNTCTHLGGPIPLRFHRGEPTKYEFDLNLGVVHITEQDCNGISEIFAAINKSWQTQVTFCIYPSKDRARDMILNVRGSPKAPAEID